MIPSDLSIPGVIAPPAVAARQAESPPWLAARRQDAWNAFMGLPMPASAQDEDWRRTDISRLHLEDFRLGAEEGESERLIAAMRARRDRAAADAALVIANASGRTSVEDSEMLGAQGVIVGSLGDAAHRHPEHVRRALQHLAVDESKFVALWNALWHGGCFVYVPRSVAARVPIWVAHPAAGAGMATFPATVVLLEDDASLTLIEDYASPAGDTSLLSSAVTLLTIGRDARLDYCVAQQLGDGVWHMATLRTHVGANGRLRFFGASFGARLQKAHWEVVLEGQGAEASLAGICFADGHQHLDHQTLQAHRAPQTSSDLLLKVAVRDTARSVYSGLIDVDRNAQQTNGYVQNRNLLLSQGARADSVPRLQIKANDVQCGHGATAGHIDDEHRFYLMARGVDPEEADRLIVRGFMADALDRSPHAGFGELVGDLLDAEIAGRAQGGLGAEAVL